MLLLDFGYLQESHWQICPLQCGHLPSTATLITPHAIWHSGDENNPYPSNSDSGSDSMSGHFWRKKETKKPFIPWLLLFFTSLFFLFKEVTPHGVCVGGDLQPYSKVSCQHIGNALQGKHKPARPGNLGDSGDLAICARFNPGLKGIEKKKDQTSCNAHQKRKKEGRGPGCGWRCSLGG